MSNHDRHTVELDGEPYRVTAVGRRLHCQYNAVGLVSIAAFMVMALMVYPSFLGFQRAMLALLVPLTIASSVLSGLTMRHAIPERSVSVDTSDPPRHQVRPFWPLRDLYALTDAGWSRHWQSEFASMAGIICIMATVFIDETFTVFVMGLLFVLMLIGASRHKGVFRGATRIA